MALFFLYGLGVLHAQSTDILRLEYLLIPENDTGIKTTRYRAAVNFPFKVKKTDYLVLGGEYNQINLGYERPLPFDKRDIERFYVLDMNLGYITKWNKEWRFVGILTPRLASNFTDGTISDDFFFNATATLWKEKSKVDKPFRIVLGLTFNSTTGLPIPLPLVSYYRKFHPNWSYTVGTSKSSFKFHQKKHTLEMSLFFDGYFMNIQNNIALPDDQLASKISLSALVGGLSYQYKIAKRLSFYMTAGKSILQSGRLRNDRRRSVFLLNNESNLYFRSGVKVSIF